MFKKLSQQKHDALAKAKALNLLAETENRLFTAAETAEFTALMATADALTPQIEAQKRLLDEERNAPASAAVQVGTDLAGTKAWANVGEQLRAVAKAQKAINIGRHAMIDPRLLASLGANESVPAEGGFTIAPEFSKDLLKRSYDVGELAKRCNDLTMESVRLIINAVDEDSRVNGSRWGGILSYWIAEGQPYPGVKPKFRQIQLVANKIVALIYATEELLEDGQMFQTYIDQAVPDEFAFQFDLAIFAGTGAGQPLGFQNSTATIVQAKDAGQATGTVSALNILNMFARMWAPSRKNAVWLINQSCEQALYPLLLAGTNATTAALMYTPPGMYGNNSPYGLLMGRPVIPIEQAANFSSQGDISLVDLTQYLLAKKGEMRSDSSIHVAFLTGEQVFRFMTRLDGQPWWKKPLTPYAASAPTLSPFITLAAR